jgi:DeoR/GlpR family transcriptional regulator of sugar metabolism
MELRSVEVNNQAERQRRIADEVLARGSVSANELVALFDVSLMTIHRDLDELERQGIVRKFRGGVTAQPSNVFESNAAYRMKTRPHEKAAIAAKARELVEPGMAIMLDDATTTYALAGQLGGITPLTVVTNYLATIDLLAAEQGIELIALGGAYDALHNSFLGARCVEAIETLRVDLLFVSVSGLADGHAFHQEQHIVSVKRAMLRAAGRKVLLLDSSKLGRVALHRLCPVADFDLVIVDDGASPAALRELEKRKVQVQVAPTAKGRR